MNDAVQEQIEHLKSIQSVRCSKPWTTLDERSVGGDFKVCCFLKNSIGCIEKKSDRDIMELWNSPDIQNLRKSMKDGNFRKWCPSGCPLLNQRVDYFKSHEFWDYDQQEYESFPQIFRENRERTIRAVLKKNIETDTFPIRLKLFPSDFCNIDCRMCDLEKTRKIEVGSNYFKNVYKLMPYLEDLTVFGGEPFACPTSRKIIFGEEMKKYPQIHFSTITNGTLVNDRNQEKLKGLRLGCFSFSIDSFNENTFRYIRRGANFSKVISNLKSFVQRAQTGELSIKMIEASCTIQEANFEEISDFIEFSHALNVKPVFGLVNKSRELLRKIDEVKRSIEKGLNRAERLECKEAINELTRIWNDIDQYKIRESKEVLLDPIRKIVGRKRVTYFFFRHPILKQIAKKMLGS